MSSALIDLAKQCCDADDYLDMGYMCAEAGMCYNPLRPIGNTFWFSIPYASNIGEQVFFYLHVALLALLAVSAYYLWKKILPTCVFVLAVVFITWPTFFYTLSDTPATLMFMEGIVLALLAQNRNSAVVFFIAGIFFGLSVLLRAAYFYPLLIASVAFFIYVLWQKNRQWPVVFIFSFFIPLSVQFISTWKHTGQWHFLQEARSNAMMRLHLNSAAAGYDTYLPQTGTYYWPPDCKPVAGLLPSLNSADISSSVCILKNRLDFYLGSYAARAYLGAGTRNFFDNNRAAQATRTNNSSSEYSMESRSLLPLPAGLYRYRVVLREDPGFAPRELQVQVDSLTVTKATATGSTTLLKKPLLTTVINNAAPSHAFDINNVDTSYLDARITSADDFYVQQMVLRPVTAASRLKPVSLKVTTPPEQSAKLANYNRVFSRSYLLINALVLFGAVCYLYSFLAKTGSPLAIFIAVLLFAVFAQCIMIIPEQRYMQGLLCACWLLSIALLSDRTKRL